MLLSRNKPSVSGNSKKVLSDLNKSHIQAVGNVEELSVEKFVEKRDFSAAITLLEYEKFSGSRASEADLWLGYCEFHNGNYKQALAYYEALKLNIYAACCYFYLGQYNEAISTLKNAPASPLKVRLLLHLANKLGDESGVMEYHNQLRDNAEDSCSLAFLHYQRSHYQEAIDIYKSLVLKNKDMLALNAFIALCYYKLDYYDIAQEVLNVYLQKIPNQDSFYLKNLKACNIYRLYNGQNAEMEIQPLLDLPCSSYGKELLDHNLVVFRSGEGALQVLPGLIDIFSEAKLNLIIYYLKQDDAKKAHDLMQDIEPSLPAEYIIKGIIYALMGIETNKKEYLDTAIQYLHLVGSSASECDTISGRQCVASAFFLQHQYEDVLLYLTSIKTYLSNDDTFRFNLAQVHCVLGHYPEAEEELLQIQNIKYRNDFTYLECLTRCLVMNRKSVQAWDLYSRMETSTESIGILHLLANDSYRTAQFNVAAKAFDALYKYDPSPEHLAAKKGACVGLFQMILTGKEDSEAYNDIIYLLRGSADPETDHILRVMNNWARENRMKMLT